MYPINFRDIGNPGIQLFNIITYLRTVRAYKMVMSGAIGWFIIS